jgi:basic membrane protein A
VEGRRGRITVPSAVSAWLSSPAMKALRLLVPVAVAAAFLAGCGGGSPTAQTSTPQTSRGEPVSTGAAPTEAVEPLKVGLVTGIGGLNDRSFNQLAYQGLQRAQRQLGVQGRVFTSKAPGDYVPNLSALARQRYDLVIGVGFPMADAVDTVARRFPKTSFAIVDYSQGNLKHAPGNVEGLLFREQEAGYLVGYLAGLLEKQEGGDQRVASVGGVEIPRVDRYIAGFRAGARAADPQVTALNGYSQDFVDPAKCKEIALDEIARGADIVFQVAGQCGLGALDAARDRNVWGIGVDADQSFLGPHILTSALKRVDVAVFKTIEQVQDGSFSGGEDTVFDAASGGIGIGRISARVPPALVDQVREVEQRLAEGRIPPIPTTVPR